jgi:hypothetical protein
MDFAFSEIRKSAISATSLVLGNFSLGDVPPYFSSYSFLKIPAEREVSVME